MRHSIVAIDQSLTCSGLVKAIWQEGQTPEFACQTIAPKSRGEQRLIDILDAVLFECETADMVFMENYAFGQVNQMSALGELGGVLKVALYKANKRAIIVGPTELKSWATGRGNAKKLDMGIAAARVKIFGNFRGDDNIVDALFMAELGWYYAAKLPGNNEKRREILARIYERNMPGYVKPKRPIKAPVLAKTDDIFGLGDFEL